MLRLLTYESSPLTTVMEKMLLVLSGTLSATFIENAFSSAWVWFGAMLLYSALLLIKVMYSDSVLSKYFSHLDIAVAGEVIVVSGEILGIDLVVGGQSRVDVDVFYVGSRGSVALQSGVELLNAAVVIALGGHEAYEAYLRGSSRSIGADEINEASVGADEAVDAMEKLHILK